MSTTPAFSSPAFTRMFGPVVGNFLSSRREFLYEQCSLHMTEKIPSSVKFGSRPRIVLMRSYSPGVRPCFETISGVTFGSVTGMRKERTFNVQRSTSNVQIKKHDARLSVLRWTLNVGR